MKLQTDSEVPIFTFLLFLVGLCFVGLGILTLVRDHKEASNCHDSTLWFYLLLTLLALLSNTPAFYLYYIHLLPPMSLIFIIASQCWLPIWGIIDLARGNDMGCPSLVTASIYPFTVIAWFLHLCVLIAWLYLFYRMYGEIFPISSEDDTDVDFDFKSTIERVHRQSTSPRSAGDVLPDEDEEISPKNNAEEDDEEKLGPPNMRSRVKFKDDVGGASVPVYRNRRAPIPAAMLKTSSEKDDTLGDNTTLTKNDEEITHSFGRNIVRNQSRISGGFLENVSRKSTPQIMICLDDCIQSTPKRDVVSLKTQDRFIHQNEYLLKYIHTNGKSSSGSNIVDTSTDQKRHLSQGGLPHSSTSTILTVKGCRPQDSSEASLDFILRYDKV